MITLKNFQPLGCDDATYQELTIILEEIALSALAGNGRLYVVGGAIRDALMQQQPKDIDLEFLNVPHGFMFKILEKMNLEPEYVGEAFGIILVTYKGVDIEIAPARSEQKTGDSRQDFAVNFDVNSVKEAARRRDLTINSMYFDVLDGTFYDYYGGATDISRGIVSPVDLDSFKEDALRIFRAARYIARYGFEADDALMEAVLGCVNDLSNISDERIRIEFRKTLKADHASKGVEFLYNVGALDRIFNGIRLEGFDFSVFDQLGWLDGLGLLMHEYMYSPNNTFKLDWSTSTEKLLDFKGQARNYFKVERLPLSLTRKEQRVLLGMCMVNETYDNHAGALALALFNNGKYGGYPMDEYYKKVLKGFWTIPNWDTLPDGKILCQNGFQGKEIQRELVESKRLALLANRI